MGSPLSASDGSMMGCGFGTCGSHGFGQLAGEPSSFTLFLLFVSLSLRMTDHSNQKEAQSSQNLGEHLPK